MTLRLFSPFLTIYMSVFWMVLVKIDVGKTMQGGNGGAYKDGFNVRQWRDIQLGV